MSERSEANLAVLRAYFDAMAAGGPPAALPLYSEDVVLDVPGSHPASDRYLGHDGIRTFGGRMAALTSGTFRLVPLDLLASDDHVVTVARASAEVAGESLEWNRVIVSTVRNSTLATLRFYESDQSAVDRLLSAGSL